MRSVMPALKNFPFRSFPIANAIRHDGPPITRQMGFTSIHAKLAIVRGAVIELAERRPKKEPQITDLRRDDFDPVTLSN